MYEFVVYFLVDFLVWVWVWVDVEEEVWEDWVAWTSLWVPGLFALIFNWYIKYKKIQN